MSIPQETNEKPNEALLLTEHFNLNEILERISDAFVALDSEWCYTYMNKKAGEIFNRDPNTTIGKLIWTTFPRAIHQQFYKACHKAMEKQVYVNIQEYYPLYNAWFESHIYPSAKGLSIFLRDITEKKKNQEAILESKRRYQTLAESSPVGIFHTDARGNTTYVNARWCQISGFSYNEALGNGWLNAVHKDDKENLIKGWQQATKTEDISVSEYRFIRPDGSIAWVMGQATPEKNSENKTVGYVGTITDITERKKAEEEIAKIHKENETVLNRISDAVVSVDNEWRYTFLNDAALASHPLGKEKTLGRRVWDVHPYLMKTVFWEKYNEAMQTKKTVEFENYYPPADKWFSVKAYPSHDGLTVFFKNITDHKKAEEQIIRERNLSDSVINSLPGIFYLYDENGKFLRWNKNLETVTGYSNREIENMHPLDFFCDEEKDLLRTKIETVFETGTADVEACLYTKTKEKFHYYFNGWSLEYEGKPCLIGMGIDITALKEAEKEIKQTSAQLRKLSTHLQNIRDEERKRIGREIHDELGQQLTAIKMDIAWIDKRTAEDAVLIKTKIKNIISLLDTSNLSVRKILNELRSDMPDTHGLKNALEWQAHQFTANTGIPLTMHHPENILKADEAIANCIFRVFQEALTNITRYANATQVISSLYVKDNNITLEVEDDGKGFDIALLKSTHRFGILGIKERVTFLKGRFDLISSPGKGTKIIISIPLIAQC